MISFLIIGSVLYLANKKADGSTSSVVAVNSKSFDQLFKTEANKYGYDWKILKAICMNESSLGQVKSVKEGLANPNNVDGSKSTDGKSWGIMQVTLTTGGDFDSTITPQKLNDPAYSVRIAAKFFAWVIIQFKDDPRLEWMIKSYNQGVGNTRKERAGVVLPLKKDVQAYWERFQRNYDKIKNEV